MISRQNTITESTKSGQERLIFSHDAHKNNFQFTTEKKKDYIYFHTDINEIPRKNQNDMRLHQLIKLYYFP